MKVYFDNAATTPMDPEVIGAMTAVMQTGYGNPSSIHAWGREARTLVEKARKTVAGLVNASPGEIFFTSGGTEADNAALRASVRDLGVKHVVSTVIEHHAVLHTLEELRDRGLVELTFLNVDSKGRIGLDELERVLQMKPRTLVSLMYANNELGTLHPIREIGDLCKKYNALFHSDTVQAMCHFPIDTRALHVDFLTAAAHKFHGPKGTGFMYISERVKMHPFITGGSQERNMRGGTENVYGIVGLARAMEIACRGMDEHRRHITGIRQHMIDRLKAGVPGVDFNSDIDGETLYTVLNVSFPPCDFAEMFLFNLDIQGIAASGGSACSSGSDAGSHVLRGVGADPDRPSVRFSFSRYNTREEVDYTVEKLKEMYLVRA